jgi:hypothetical protein
MYQNFYRYRHSVVGHSLSQVTFNIFLRLDYISFAATSSPPLLMICILSTTTKAIPHQLLCVFQIRRISLRTSYYPQVLGQNVCVQFNSRCLSSPHRSKSTVVALFGQPDLTTSVSALA